MPTWNDIKTYATTGWRKTAFDWIQGNLFWILIIFAIAFVLISFRGCTSDPTTSTTSTATPALGAGWLFLKLAFAGLIVTAYRTREKEKLAWTFTGLALLVFLVLLGKLDGLMAWGTLGFPIMAGLCVLGYLQIPPDRNMKSFLGFSAGILILFWMFLLYSTYSTQIELGFLKTIFKADADGTETAKIIFTIFLASFIFAIWKKSKIFYAISFIVLLSFFGKAVIGQIAARFPEQLKPPAEVSEGAGSLLKSAGKSMKRLSEQIDNPPAPVTPLKKEQEKQTAQMLKNVTAPTSPKSSPPAPKAQTEKPSAQPQTQKFMVDIEWHNGSTGKAIRGLQVELTENKLSMSDGTASFTGSKNAQGQYSGECHDDKSSSTFTATIDPNGNGNGQFTNGSRFQIIRR